MSKFCGKCGKPIEDTMDYCPDCEAKLLDEQTITLNPTPVAETQTVNDQPTIDSVPIAPAPAARPVKRQENTRPVVAEFPIVRVAPRAAAIAEEKKALKRSFLMLAGIILVALICVAAITFGIYKLATRPDKEKDDADKVPETTAVLGDEPKVPEVSVVVPDDPKDTHEQDIPEEETLNDREVIERNYPLFADVIDFVYACLGETETETDSLENAVIEAIQDSLVVDENVFTKYKYDLLDITEDEDEELVIFELPELTAEEDLSNISQDLGSNTYGLENGSQSTDTNAENNIDDAAKVLFIFDIETDESQSEPKINMILSPDEGTEYYLHEEESQNGDSYYMIIKHFTDSDNTEKYVIYENFESFDSPDNIYELCLIKAGDVWYELNNAELDDTSKQTYKDKYALLENTDFNSFEPEKELDQDLNDIMPDNDNPTGKPELGEPNNDNNGINDGNNADLGNNDLGDQPVTNDSGDSNSDIDIPDGGNHPDLPGDNHNGGFSNNDHDINGGTNMNQQIA